MNGLKRTPLFDRHQAAGGKMVPFAGWEMPVSYGEGILEEHKTVRTHAGLFDVSHMGRFRFFGPQAGPALDYLTTGKASGLEEGRFLYTLLLEESGGVIDDLLVGRLGGEFLVVVNAANLQIDFEHMSNWCCKLGAAFLVDESEQSALLALQGPASREILKKVIGNPEELDGLPYYRMIRSHYSGEEIVLSRTGYTGELGYEIFIDRAKAASLWDALLGHGAKPCGLGARDTLRLEMGYALYGHELDRDHTPLEAGLSWVVDFDKEDFIGRPALLRQREKGLERVLRGIIGSRRGDIPRPGYLLKREGREIARLVSGGVAPSLGLGIGTAYLPQEFAAQGSWLDLELRGRAVEVEVVRPPFYKEGTAKV